MAVGNGGHCDAVLGAIEALAGQDRVQYLVAGFVLRLIGANFALDLIETVELLIRADLGAQQRDLVLQIVILLVDKADGFLPDAVVLILAFENAL